jgi:hypothetical protein
MAFGILLIHSIIHFALPAPVLVQEKRQERVDVVHIPKDVITVLGKRWEESLEKLWEEYLKTAGKPVESSDSTLSPSLVPGPDHGLTNVVQLPVPNPSLSAANPDPLMEPSSYSSSKSSMQGLRARGNYLWGLLDDLWSYIRGDDLVSEYGSGHELTGAHANSNSRPSIHPSADPDFDWDYWINAEDPSPGPVSLKEVGQASGYAPSPPEPEQEVVTPSSPSSNLGSLPPSTDPELHLDHQSSNADSQPVDLQAAAVYAAKGKAKVSRRISGTARDVGNAAQGKLQPAERSLDPGE